MIGMWLFVLMLAGCGRGCMSGRTPFHFNPNMDLQPKYKAQAESAFFYDGATMRVPVAGTVARGELREDAARYSGKRDDGSFIEANPLTVDEALLERGEKRYTIYCAVCHTDRGDGEGVLFERGKVPTTSFHDDRIREMPDGQIFDTVTNGLGLMPGYGYPIPPDDRWAIIAHLRRLQQQYQGEGE